MKKVMTGGMYSFYRGILGLWVALEVFGLLSGNKGMAVLWLDGFLEGAGAGVGLVLSLLLLLGKWDRMMALLLLLFVEPSVSDPLMIPLVNPLTFLLALHLFVPVAPYGSLDALGRPDPGNGWALPEKFESIVWLFVAAMTVTSAFTLWLDGSASFEVKVLITVFGLVGLLGLVERARPIAFLALNGCLPLMTSFGSDLVLVCIPLLVLCISPSWWPAKTTNEPILVFYDGMCGLCHRAVRFVMSEDVEGQSFALSPLQGGLLEERIGEEAVAELPDSMILLEPDNSLHVRSDAVVAILLQLGGWWRPLGMLLKMVPRPLRNLYYDGVARVRKMIFPAPKEMCPVVPLHLRKRFR